MGSFDNREYRSTWLQGLQQQATAAGLEPRELKRVRVGEQQGALGAAFTTFFGGSVSIDELAIAQFEEPRMKLRWTTVVPFSRNAILAPQHLVTVPGEMPAPLWVEGPGFFWSTSSASCAGSPTCCSRSRRCRSTSPR